MHLDTCVNKTNFTQYLSPVYFVNQPLHGSGIFVVHHQEVYCIYTTIGTCCAFQLTVCWWPTESRLKSTTRTNCCVYIYIYTHTHNTCISTYLGDICSPSSEDVIYIYIYIYTGCPRRNVPDFGRVFLRSNYTDITQNTCIQS